MISEDTKKMIAENHYEDFKEEVMDLISIPELMVSDRIISLCNDMYNEPHSDDGFDDAREIIEIIEEKWVQEQFKNISGFNTPEFLAKYETKEIADLRVKMHGQNEYSRGFEDAVKTWERNFAEMSSYQFSDWKIKHKDIILNELPQDPELDDWDKPTYEEEQAWKEMEKSVVRGDR